MKKFSFAVCLSLVFALFLTLGTGSAFAQNGNARIRGTVTDPTGAVVPNATVIATNAATGVKYPTKTNASGDYLFPQLPVGTYSVSATAAGFKTFQATGITLNIDQEYSESIKLPVGGSSETLEVAADSLQVNTTDMQLNNVVSSSQMEELPLIGRSFTNLELTLPGVQASSDRFGSFSVSGSQTQQSEYLVNGADTNDIALNTIAFTPNLDAIDQFNLIDGPLNAEYDRNSGGIVSATIKQGNNHFHGDAFEFYRDTFLNTLAFFQKTLQPNGLWQGTVSPYHQNIYGGTIGGPVIKDKLFFFAAYQGTHSRTPDSINTSVYSAPMLSGNFAAADNPTTTGARPTGTAAWGNFLGNPIPSSLSITGATKACNTAGETWAQCAYDNNGNFGTTSFNSIAKNLVAKYVPAPNNGTYGYTAPGTTATLANQYIGRIDYDISPKNQLTVLGIWSKQKTTDTLPFTGASLAGFGDQSTLTFQQYTVDYVRQFTSSAVNDLGIHWTRFNYQAVEPQSVVTPSSLGFSIFPEDAAAASVPTISVSGNTLGFTLGFSTNGPQPRIDQVYQLDDTFSKVFGHHTVKFGYDGRRFNVSNPFYADNSGAFGFGNTAQYSTGDGALDFLLGDPNTYAQGSGATIQADAFLNYLFVQDTWKLTNSFTLDYGLGYSIDTPLHNNQYAGEGIACLVAGETSTIFPNSPKGFVYPGDPGCTNTGQAYTRYSELGPRIGFAWAPDLGKLSGAPGKLSIRGGFGIYYDRTEEESALQTLETPPFGTSTAGAGDFGGTPEFATPFTDINGGGAEANRFPYTFPTKGQAINYGNLEPLYNISTFGPSFRAPYAENFQLSVEREFPSRVVARVSYIGSLARHNQITYDGNPITPAGHAACMASKNCNSATNAIYREEESYFYPGNTLLGAIDPNTGLPGFLDIGYVGSESSSSYNSFQASVTKAPTHGLSFQLSYTYSHALDGGSSFENAGFGESSTRGYNQFPGGAALNYGDSQYDARNRLVFAPIYVSPMLHGKSWYSPLNLALSGWEVSGITTLAQGFPFDVSYAGGSANSEWCPDFLNFYACPDVPNQVAPVTVIGNPRSRVEPSGSTSGSAYLSKASFTNEALGTFGNTHRNPGHGPGINDTDMVLAKNFNLSADAVRKLQLRLTSANVFNHTQFTNPSTTWSDTVLTNAKSNFGAISGTQSARLTQLAVKIYF